MNYGMNIPWNTINNDYSRTQPPHSSHKYNIELWKPHTNNGINFGGSQKLYVDFQLCGGHGGGSVPLTPVLFKGQLYMFIYIKIRTSKN